LPVGIQLTAAHGQDARVLHMAAQLAPVIGSPS